MREGVDHCPGPAWARLPKPIRRELVEAEHEVAHFDDVPRRRCRGPVRAGGGDEVVSHGADCHANEHVLHLHSADGEGYGGGSGAIHTTHPNNAFSSMEEMGGVCGAGGGGGGIKKTAKTSRLECNALHRSEQFVDFG